MSRIVDAAVQVTLGPDAAGDMVPVSFVYLRQRHLIAEILDDWIMTGQWWEDANAVGRAPSEVHFYRVQTTKGGVFELLQESATTWRLYKVYD